MSDQENANAPEVEEVEFMGERVKKVTRKEVETVADLVEFVELGGVNTTTVKVGDQVTVNGDARTVKAIKFNYREATFALNFDDGTMYAYSGVKFAILMRETIEFVLDEQAMGQAAMIAKKKRMENVQGAEEKTVAPVEPEEKPADPVNPDDSQSSESEPQ